MTEYRVTAAAHSRADSAAIISLLDDVDGWSNWARPLVWQTRWERWGQPAPAGPGAVRRVGLWPGFIREQILSRDSHGQTYTVITPVTFRCYHGAVHITPASPGTDIDWQVQFVPRAAAAGPFLHKALQYVIAGLLAKLAAQAESLYATGGVGDCCYKSEGVRP
ncbi:SRPBCC family protein [Mycobacterium arosiense]|uniref:Polyketide cyclase n=1 Tax=Mycobacterium arosiense ATCC BAA-1401 = DSM 45069 TaxID=1265311 RepID=A0A1W9ZBL4_MYCAI|nr:SRPBCC family protein [Mycobacterium arosiense]ORA11420.1 hypothetical protein BST14_18590 [Mycobacterium arosiense ATCC BAA-1401 = DSM 45069]